MDVNEQIEFYENVQKALMEEAEIKGIPADDYNLNQKWNTIELIKDSLQALNFLKSYKNDESVRKQWQVHRELVQGDQ